VASLQAGFAQVLAPSQSLEVSPPSQELAADPGQVVTVKAKLRNRSNDTINVKVRVEDFTAVGEEGQVALVEKGPYSITSWTKLEPDAFVLRAFESREVTAAISVPDTGAGGRYGSFVFSVGGAPGEGTTTAVAQEIASLFLVRISGPVNERLSLAEFSAPSFVEFGPVAFTLTFKNAGNVHVRPFGLVNVRNVLGKTVQDVVVAGQANIFPGASRAVSVSLDKKWLIGPFTAQAVLNYGSKNESLSATTTFFAFPVRVAAAGLLLGVVLYLIRKRIRLALKALMGK
jgi:hypothetical protein